MWSSIWYTKQCMQCHCHDILSTYRTKCMLFAFSRSFGDEVKLCSIFADVILSLLKLRFPQFTVQNYKRRGDRKWPMFARDITTASHCSSCKSIYSCVYALTQTCIVQCMAPAVKRMRLFRLCLHVRTNVEEWYTDTGLCAHGQYEFRTVRIAPQYAYIMCGEWP